MLHSRLTRVPRALLWTTGILLLLSAPVVAAEAPHGPKVPEYTIGVEDQLQVLVWKEPELSLTVAVRPDGKITVPLIGDVQAAGRSSEQLAAEIKTALTEFVNSPVVTVIVGQINNFKVYVLGEVGSQGVLQLKSRTRLLQALAQMGGLSEFADKSNVILIREVNGAEVRIPIDYRKLVKGVPEAENIFVEPGDTILVN